MCHLVDWGAVIRDVVETICGTAVLIVFLWRFL